MEAWLYLTGCPGQSEACSFVWCPSLLFCCFPEGSLLLVTSGRSCSFWVPHIPRLFPQAVSGLNDWAGQDLDTWMGHLVSSPSLFQTDSPSNSELWFSTGGDFDSFSLHSLGHLSGGTFGGCTWGGVRECDLPGMLLGILQYRSGPHKKELSGPTSQ